MKKLIVLIAIAVACSPQSDTNSEKSTDGQITIQESVSIGDENFLIDLDKEIEEITLDSVNGFGSKFPEKARIRRQTAKEKIERYKFYQKLLYEKFGQEYDPKKDVYGFAFSLDHIKELTYFIDSVNRVVTTQEDSLIGIRVYMGMDTKIRPGVIKFKPDAFLMPIKYDGSNYYAVDDDLVIPDSLANTILMETNYTQTGNDGIFNRSVPCPSECD